MRGRTDSSGYRHVTAFTNDRPRSIEDRSRENLHAANKTHMTAPASGSSTLPGDRSGSVRVTRATYSAGGVASHSHLSFFFSGPSPDARAPPGSPYLPARAHRWVEGCTQRRRVPGEEIRAFGCRVRRFLGVGRALSCGTVAVTTHASVSVPISNMCHEDNGFRHAHVTKARGVYVTLPSPRFNESRDGSDKTPPRCAFSIIGTRPRSIASIFAHVLSRAVVDGVSPLTTRAPNHRILIPPSYVHAVFLPHFRG